MYLWLGCDRSIDISIVFFDMLLLWKVLIMIRNTVEFDGKHVEILLCVLCWIWLNLTCRVTVIINKTFLFIDLKHSLKLKYFFILNICIMSHNFKRNRFSTKFARIIFELWTWRCTIMLITIMRVDWANNRWRRNKCV